MKVIITESKFYSTIKSYINKEYPGFKLTTNSFGDIIFKDEFGTALFIYDSDTKLLNINLDFLINLENMFNLKSQNQYTPFFEYFIGNKKIEDYYYDSSIYGNLLPTSFKKLVIEILDDDFDKIVQEACPLGATIYRNEWKECFAYQITNKISEGRENYSLGNSLFWTMYQNIISMDEFDFYSRFDEEWSNHPHLENPDEY